MAEPDWIMERVLDVEGETRKVTVSLARPLEQPAGEWGCTYRISGLDGHDDTFMIFGFDSLQSFQCALTVVGGALAGSEDFPKLRWCDDTDLGFPIPNKSS